MSKVSHLYRRGNTLYFRLSVPDRYRSILKVSEFTQSLRTQNRNVAIPAAYRLASEAKQLFLYINSLMTDNGHINEDLLSEALEAIEASEVAGKNKRTGDSLKTLLLKKKHSIVMDTLKERHEEELEAVRTKAKAEAYDKLTSITIIGASPSQQAPITEKPIESKAPLLRATYDEFVKSRTVADKKKFVTFGNLFIEKYLGNKKIDLVTQKEVNEFFILLTKVAGGRRGKSKDYLAHDLKKRVGLAEAEKNNDDELELMGVSTFNGTYIMAAKQFFKWLKLHYEEYAPLVSVEDIEYKEYGGLRKRRDNKQRALRVGKNINEVAVLMDCQPMIDFSKSFVDSHKFWLPMIGLFTGARVNEICQLNPQADILQDEKSGIWYFNLTDDNAGVGIEKSHKNKNSKRKVPIHSKLFGCGFSGYLDKVKGLGHTRIFDKFKPVLERASPNAEKFFSQHLKDVGLHDSKTKDKDGEGLHVVGMHSLRHTFMTETCRRLVAAGDTTAQAFSKIQPIVGHCESLVDENGKSLAVTAGYIDIDALTDLSENLKALQVVIETLDYGVVFPVTNT